MEKVREKSRKPACLSPGCDRDTYGGSRGLCLSHYAVKQSLVKRGRTTWEELEKNGLTKPKLTKEENAYLRSKETVKLKRVFSRNLNKFIFVEIK